MEELFLPVLSHFQNENMWTSSVGNLRYKVVPAGEELTVEVWRGPWCYEFSQVEENRKFPLTEEGLGELRAWVLERAAEINARPAETLEETIARRDAAQAAHAEEKTEG